MDFEETDLTDCGQSGRGTPAVCCVDCPNNIYGLNQAGTPMACLYKTDAEFSEDRKLWEKIHDHK